MDNRQPEMIQLIQRLYLLALLALLAPAALAIDLLGGSDDELLKPEQAFLFSTTLVDDHTVQVNWTIADGYYMYRDRIKFSSDTPGISLGEPDLPAGTVKDDEFFGKIATFRKAVAVTIPVIRTADAPGTLELKAVSQGCADIGVCYPPHTQLASLDLPVLSPDSLASMAIPAASAANALQSISDRLGLSGAEDDFLDPDVAFQVEALEVSPGLLEVRWTIADGYYLYRDKLKVALADNPDIALGDMKLPEGKVKQDEFFGDVQVFYHEVTAQLPVQHLTGKADRITLQIGHQGCADAGICYPPAKKEIPLILAAANAIVPAAAAAAPATGMGDGAQDVSITSQRQDDIVRVLATSSLGWTVLFFLGAGILLAFTACMYPMIPIISSIIVGQGEGITTGRAFGLTFIYVQGVALTYAVIGVVSAQLGAGVQAFFQNPWILSFFALVFVLLALSMFGFYNLQLPASMQARLSETSNRFRGGTLLGVGAMGVLSALIVGPCAGPVLIGALIYTSQSGDYLTGALAMYALGLGLGLPLLAIGTSGGKLLPKAGGWMDTVKAVFGVVLLAVAVLMLERILPGPVTLLLWALLLIIPAVYMGALDSLPAGVSGWRRLWKGLGIAMLVYGIILIIGATTGARDPFNPLRNLNTGVISSADGTHTSQHLQFTRIKNIDDLNAALARSSAAGRPVMLDFYADWCTYCIKMEDYTFSAPAVQQSLADTTLLQADVTANDAEDLALLNHLGLFAPPAILFFGANGKELREARLVGFKDAEDFLAHLKDTFQ
ncbi:MAG: protein-disulfide reductase DsbD [Gammaproteobacteria bacterium]